MSNTLYNTQRYARITHQEIITIVLTGAIAAFALSARDLLFERFGEIASVLPWLFLTLTLSIACLVAVVAGKLVAVRVGYTISYVPHAAGLMLGVVLSVLSAGYLPVFLPGGFRFARPERLRIGKHEGWYKGWEVGLVAAMFPVALTFLLLPLNALALFSGSDLWRYAVVGTWLCALYACVPVPMIAKNKDKLKDPRDTVKSLRGCAFGLDVFYASGPWFLLLCAYVLATGILAWMLTVAGYPLSLWVYALSALLALLTAWVVGKFFR